MKKFCLCCGLPSDYYDEKCSKCGTTFGSVKIETKNTSEAARVVVKENQPSKIPKFLDPSMFDDEDMESEYDFSSLADELERELELPKNGAVKNKSLKTINGADLFRNIKQ